MSAARNVLRTTLEAAMELQEKDTYYYELLFHAIQRLISHEQEWRGEKIMYAEAYYETIDEFLELALSLSKSHKRPFAQALTAVVDSTEDIFALGHKESE